MRRGRHSVRNPLGSWLRVAAAAVSLSVCAAAAHADEADADFYRGKLVRVIIPTPPGGIYDLFARLIAEHLPRHIRGNPRLIPQNMPGASGLFSGNYVGNLAPRDGTVIAAAHSSTMTGPLLSPDGAKYDITTLSWIGNITKDPFVAYVWHTSKIHSLEDLKTTEATFGGNSVGAASIDYAIAAKALFGLKLKIVTGYANSPNVKLAMERGEIDGTFGNGWTSLNADEPSWMPEHKVTILLQFGMTRHPALPDVPLFIDLAKTDADRQVLELLLARQEFSKAYYAPPGVPEDRLNILRRAFDETMQDPAFLNDAARMMAPVIGPMRGEEVETAAKEIAATPRSVVQRVENMFAQFQDGK